VPSYDRVDTLQRNTLPSLDSVGIDVATQVDLFVATEQVRRSVSCKHRGKTGSQSRHALSTQAQQLQAGPVCGVRCLNPLSPAGGREVCADAASR
jgi:hypothetical protein